MIPIFLQKYVFSMNAKEGIQNSVCLANIKVPCIFKHGSTKPVNLTAGYIRIIQFGYFNTYSKQFFYLCIRKVKIWTRIVSCNRIQIYLTIKFFESKQQLMTWMNTKTVKDQKVSISLKNLNLDFCYSTSFIVTSYSLMMPL